MQAPIYDDEDEPPFPRRQEEPSFLVWAIAGGGLVLLYVLTFVILRSI